MFNTVHPDAQFGMPTEDERPCISVFNVFNAHYDFCDEGWLSHSSFNSFEAIPLWPQIQKLYY